MSVHLLPTTALVLTTDFVRENCVFSSDVPMQTLGLWMKPGGCGYGSEVPALGMVGWALPRATASTVGCGNCCIKPLVSRQLLGARHFVSVVYSPCFRLSRLSPLACFDDCVGGFPSSPPAATADMAKIRDDLRNRCQSPMFHIRLATV